MGWITSGVGADYASDVAAPAAPTSSGIPVGGRMLSPEISPQKAAQLQASRDAGKPLSNNENNQLNYYRAYVRAGGTQQAPRAAKGSIFDKAKGLFSGGGGGILSMFSGKGASSPATGGEFAQEGGGIEEVLLPVAVIGVGGFVLWKIFGKKGKSRAGKRRYNNPAASGARRWRRARSRVTTEGPLRVRQTTVGSNYEKAWRVDGDSRVRVGRGPFRTRSAAQGVADYGNKLRRGR